MITYEPLWETMERKAITKYQLIFKYGILKSTLARMKKNKPILTTTIDDLCKILNCNVQDIITYIPDELPPQ